MPWIGPGRMIATSTTRSSRFIGRDFGSVCIWARLSTWKTPTVSAAWSIAKTSGIVLGQPVEVEADGAVVLDQLERLVDRGEHPEPEQVELDQLERLDVALVVLDDDAVLHRRPLERGDVDERRGGDEHPAACGCEVAREAVDPGAELEPALPVGQVRRAAAARLRRRLGLDAGDARVARPPRPIALRPAAQAGPSGSAGRADPSCAAGGSGMPALRVDRPAAALPVVEQRRRDEPVRDPRRSPVPARPSRSQATLAGVSPGPPSSSPCRAGRIAAAARARRAARPPTPARSARRRLRVRPTAAGPDRRSAGSERAGA